MKDIDARTPSLAFLGLGWIGRNRMEALAASGRARIAGLADPDPQAVEAAAEAARGHGAEPSGQGATLDDLLGLRPDGVVIATPSALHAAQSIAALQAGAAVFCQKPLGRDAAETRAVIEAARRADRLLASDLSYRHTAAMQALAAEVRSGALGEIQAVDLTFHNAYGPDKPWFRDRARSGGGCLIDLGVHMVDLALWLLDWPAIACRSAHLRAGGAPLDAEGRAVEDFALATLETGAGVPVRLACSWNLPAGCDAVIRLEIWGSEGGAAFANIGGSFFDFEAHRHDGCNRTELAAPPDDWGGRAALDWLERLAAGQRYDPACERLADVAAALDAIYAAAGQGQA